MRSDELRSLRQNANEMEGKDIGLVYDLLYAQQLSLVTPRRFDDPEHLLDYGAGQVASSSQLQPTDFGCSSKQDQGIGRNRRSGDFRIGEIGFEPDRVIVSRGFLSKSIQAVEFQHRPRWFDAIEPPTNFGILQESWCDHMMSDTGLLGFSPSGLARSRTYSAAARHQR